MRFAIAQRCRHENAVIRLIESEREYAEGEQQYSDLCNRVCSLLQRLDDSMNADKLKGLVPLAYRNQTLVA